MASRRSSVQIRYAPPLLFRKPFCGSLAQLVEQRLEEPCVLGSSPRGATSIFVLNLCLFLWKIAFANKQHKVQLGRNTKIVGVSLCHRAIELLAYAKELILLDFGNIKV